MAVEMRKTPAGDEYGLITQASDLPKAATCIANAKGTGALDLETTALSPLDGDIRLFQFSDAVGNAFVIDLFQTGGLGPVKDAVASREDLIWIIQNAKFEQKWLGHHEGLTNLWPIFDPFRASAIIHNGKQMGHDLYALYARELDEYPCTEDLGGSNWAGALSAEQYDYAADDVSRKIHLLRDSLKPKLAKYGLNQTALVEFGAVLPEAECELNGIYLDPGAWTEVYEANIEQAELYRKKLLANLPNPTNQLLLPGIEPPRKESKSTKNVFNLDSSEQMLKALQMMGVRERVKDKETGKISQIPLTSTKEIILAQYAAKYPVIKDIFKYRGFSKNASSFGLKYLDHIHPSDGRIHCDYFPFTGAGRYACSKPNIQQIPRDRRFRACFQARPGWKFVAADYSGIEMRIAAEVAGCKALAGVFITGKDAHTYTAAMLNNISYDEFAAGVRREDPKYKKMRQEAKAVNFGLLYGMGAPKLVLYAMANYGVTLTLKQAHDFRNKFFEAYPGLKLWHNVAYRDGQRMGVTATLNGRVRDLDPQKTNNEWFNTPVQGTGADALKKALRLVLFNLRRLCGDDARLVHHVHDEILVECRDDPEIIAKTKQALEEGMHEAMKSLIKRVPVETEAAVGDNWAEVH